MSYMMMVTKTQELKDIDAEIADLRRRRYELVSCDSQQVQRFGSMIVMNIDIERSDLDHKIDMLQFRREIAAHRGKTPR